MRYGSIIGSRSAYATSKICWLSGISVTFQTVAEWAAKFGLTFAHQLRRRARGHFADKWHLDEGVPRGTHSSVGAELHGR